MQVSTMKILLQVFCVYGFLVGIIYIALGLTTAADLKKNHITQLYLPYFVTIIGLLQVIVCIVNLLLMESGQKLKLIINAALFIGLGVLMLFCYIIPYVTSNKIKESIRDDLREHVRNYYKSNTSEEIKDVHRSYRCCGVWGREDFTEELLDVPPSCMSFTYGCYFKIYNHYNKILFAPLNYWGVHFLFNIIAGLAVLYVAFTNPDGFKLKEGVVEDAKQRGKEHRKKDEEREARRKERAERRKAREKEGKEKRTKSKDKDKDKDKDKKKADE